MNQITDDPLEYQFGLNFNYAVWTADTVITMCNVPWNNDYRDIVKFDDRKALNNYINAMEFSNTQIKNMSYAKVNQPIRIDIPFNKAYKYNYLRASNPIQPVPGGDTQRDFYYFITDIRYVAPNTTEIVVQLDVWQTFGYDVTFGNSYIERGHIGIANSRQMDNHGRDYLTVPEGLDTGSEYQVIATRSEFIMGNGVYDILVASTVDLLADAGTAAAPKLTAANGGYLNLLPTGATFYVFDSPASLQFFLNLKRDQPWVTQGIVSITLIPPVSRYISGFTFAAHGTPTVAPSALPQKVNRDMWDAWRESDGIWERIPERYRHLKKFITHPYMGIEMTTWNGTPLAIKPESWNSDNAEVQERISMVPPGQRIVVMPKGYNATSDDEAWIDPNDDGGEYLDFATVIGNFPTMAVVNNMAMSYLAQNSHGIAFMNQSADWSQQRALRGNQVSYDQASSAMFTQEQMGITARNADWAQTALTNRTMGNQAILGTFSTIGGGATQGLVAGGAGAGVGAAGGLVGAIANNIGTMINQDANNQAASIRNASSVANIQDQVGHGSLLRDTNKSLADWAARGDYENTIAGINAKIQDSKMTQPTVSGQVGGEAMNIIHNDVRVSLRWKMIDLSHIRLIGEYWLRYGYAVRQFGVIPASLMVMSNFTYWKLTETYITSAPMPEGFKQAIRGIFEKGVTVWADPNKIGAIDIADNEPLEGIEL